MQHTEALSNLLFSLAFLRCLEVIPLQFPCAYLLLGLHSGMKASKSLKSQAFEKYGLHDLEFLLP